MPNSPLSGVRIWLSGSVPEGSTDQERQRIEDFTRQLAEEAFLRNAILVHGFHPSLTPTLLAAAATFKDRSGNRRAPLHLLVSTHYQDQTAGTYLGRTLDDLRQYGEVDEIPEGPSETASVDRLRDALAARADALVALGGKWWTTNRSHAGVPREFDLAITRGIPSFLLGGLGGATSGYLEEHEEILRNLRNGLDRPANLALAHETDISVAVHRILGQLALLPLCRRETQDGERFRILSLDGGGVRGAFTAAILAQWEHRLGRRIIDHFDLIAGTSTGGILAIGLGLGVPAKEMLNFYKQHARDIFPLTSLSEKVWHKLRQLVTSKFEVEELEKQLAQAYDAGRTTTLADSQTRLLITSYNLTANTVALYRTPHYPHAKANDAPLSVSVGRATSAAPTYFKPATVDDPIAPHEAVDGGVWANCPAMAALSEAVGVLKIPLDRIDLLSVGTAGFAPVIDPPANAGLSGWAAKAADLFLKSQAQATLHYAKHLLGQEHFLRVDDPERSVEDLDNPDKLEHLIGRGQQCANDQFAAVEARFLNGNHVRPWRSTSVERK
jgi:hypothetical protein